jgi:hypothetical protein
LLTCKDFLAELSEYLDDSLGIEIREKLEAHLKACPNCWVVCDTTKKTIQVFKGHGSSCSMPTAVHERLMQALDKKAAEKSLKVHGSEDQLS